MAVILSGSVEQKGSNLYSYDYLEENEHQKVDEQQLNTESI